MAVHPLALSRGLSRDDIQNIVEEAAATIAIDNGPTMVLVLGSNPDGRLLEASGVIRDEDVFVVHASPARPDYQRLYEIARSLPGATPDDEYIADDSGNGRSVDGLQLTDSLIRDLAIAAEKGHDVETLLIRVRTGRPAPLSIGDTLRLNLDAPTYAAVSQRADADGVSIHEVMRRAIRSRLKTP